MVWAGIWDDQITGPYFFDNNITGKTYLHMIQNYLMDFLDDVPLQQRNNMFFQEDGAPLHYALVVRNYLSEQFPNRWIGRRGLVEWPPRSPDLTPLDFFLWGHLKSGFTRTAQETLTNLRKQYHQNVVKLQETLIRVKA
jgi:hypothetical protein